MDDKLIEDRRADLVLSTDRARLRLDTILTMLHASHWGAGVTHAVLSRAIANSVCVGIYQGDEQLAFARAVTDLATYAYLTDVIVAPAARGQGLGTWVVETFLEHPDLQGLRRVTLFTRDARLLYEKLGFSTKMPASTYMEMRPGPNRKR